MTDILFKLKFQSNPLGIQIKCICGHVFFKSLFSLAHNEYVLECPICKATDRIEPQEIKNQKIRKMMRMH